jgi:hypothetical protein
MGVGEYGGTAVTEHILSKVRSFPTMRHRGSGQAPSIPSAEPAMILGGCPRNRAHHS